MVKDTYWFPHDYEPTSDPKMQAMLSDYGGYGYGIYWRVVEMLHSDASHKLPFKKYIYSAIVKQMQPNAKQNKVLLNSAEFSVELVEKFISDCIGEYELFVSDETHFWSNRAKRNIEKKANISEERSKAGKMSSEYRKNKVFAEQNVANVEQNSANVEQKTATSEQSSTIRREEKREEENNIKKERGGVASPAPPPHSVVGYNHLPDGRSYIEREMFFTASDFNGLPKEKAQSVQSLLSVVKKVEVSEPDLINLWEVFKTMNLTFQKPYRNKDDVYNHFSNWCKTQTFSKSGRSSAPKKDTGKIKGKVVGIEFIENFTKCKMSDGSVVDLDANQSSSAQYLGMKASSITKS